MYTSRRNKGNTTDVTNLEALKESIEKGDMIVPRQYVKRYGFAAKNIDDNVDYLEGFLFRPEYNLLDTIRFYMASIKYQDTLLLETINHPISEIVTKVEVPVYFLMGKYDGMTSPEAAKTYLDSLISEKEKATYLSQLLISHALFQVLPCLA